MRTARTVDSDWTMKQTGSISESIKHTTRCTIATTVILSKNLSWRSSRPHTGHPLARDVAPSSLSPCSTPSSSILPSVRFVFLHVGSCEDASAVLGGHILDVPDESAAVAKASLGEALAHTVLDPLLPHAPVSLLAEALQAGLPLLPSVGADEPRAGGRLKLAR